MITNNKRSHTIHICKLYGNTHKISPSSNSLEIFKNLAKWQNTKSSLKKLETFLHANNKHDEKDRRTPVHSSLKEKKVSRNTYNQESERTLQLKLQVSKGKN